jgi:hypothetical protein
MATLTQVREAMKARLATVRNLTAYAIEPSVPFCPAAWVLPVRVAYHATYEGDLTYTMGVTVAVLLGDLGQAQTALDDYLAPSGTKSVVAALEAPPAGGDALESVRVIAMTNYGTREMGGKSVLTAGLEVEVYA